jgi:hypothetical protein
MDKCGVSKGIPVDTEVDGRHSPLDRNTLVSSGLILQPGQAGDVCIVYRVHLATRSVDLLALHSAIVYTGSEVQWVGRTDRTSHRRCGTCDGAPNRFEGCT